jgi:hypothetical protein
LFAHVPPRVATADRNFGALTVSGDHDDGWSGTGPSPALTARIKT